jgi:hypothetical protein
VTLVEETLRFLDLARAWAVWAPLLGLGTLLVLTIVRLALAEVAGTGVRVGRIKRRSAPLDDH